MKFLTVSLKTAFFFFPHLACSRRDKCINRRLKKTPNKVGAEEDAAPNPAEGQQRCATHTQCPGVLGGGVPRTGHSPGVALVCSAFTEFCFITKIVSISSSCLQRGGGGGLRCSPADVFVAEMLYVCPWARCARCKMGGCGAGCHTRNLWRALKTMPKHAKA